MEFHSIYVLDIRPQRAAAALNNQRLMLRMCLKMRDIPQYTLQ